MTVIRPEHRRVEQGTNGPCGPFEAQWLSEPGGLTQFGAVIETLPPGSASSIKHWHTDEDELVLVLDGAVTLVEGDAEHTLHPGDAATFRAGDPVGHCLRNDSTAPVRYLVVGTRAGEDWITYPDHDTVCHRAGANTPVRWTDLAGAPADSPYST